MEIEVRKEPTLNQYDDGCREVSCKIGIGENLPPRRQREAAIYETLAALLGYVVVHDRLLTITHILMDVLDQLDAMNG